MVRFCALSLPLVTTLSVALGSGHALAQHKLDVSMETGPNHVRNLSMQEMADELKKRSGGKLELRLFHGAAKFKDTDVPKALNQGTLDMGLPGTWQLGKYIEDFDAPDLPMFYGRDRKQVYKVWDGEPGKDIGARIEKKLGVKVIGRWMDLGAGQTFTTKTPINVVTDMKAMKIRIPGGSANIARYEALGANAIKIAWPDVAQALQRNTVDGLFTTFESLRSAKLWDSGVKYAYVNNQNFLQYLPLVSNTAWNKLPKDMQDLLVTVWNERIDAVRDRADARQTSAREDAIKQGVKVVDMTEADAAASRKLLMSKQDALVKELKISTDFVKKIEAALAK
jgi:TRAP-type C4-dicarboxylate transport system substrate-binding protein